MRTPYAGVATRAVGLAIDVAIINVIVFATAAVFALVGQLVGNLELDQTGRILAAGGWFLTVAAYFVVFWSTTGQTPGMRMMALRVVGYDGQPPSTGHAVLRLIGLGLAIIPVFLGFVPALLDARRRALPDFMGRTVVLYADAELPPQPATAPAAAPADVQPSG
jgi:uncharacterized RDD family membrane protein YckC